MRENHQDSPVFTLFSCSFPEMCGDFPRERLQKKRYPLLKYGLIVVF